MQVTLIKYTPDADALCGQAAALCTGYKGDPLIALKHAMASGHESVIEHANFTFLVEGVSRVLLAQLTRHRLASFSVQSQRYVNQSEQDTMIPSAIMKKDATKIIACLVSQACFEAYEQLIGMGIDQEDARFILPQGITTKLMMTMNARELRHFFSLRSCNRAQWEIRQLSDEMLKQCKKVAPVLFNQAGPGCLTGHCPEGRKCCGHPREMGEWDS